MKIEELQQKPTLAFVVGGRVDKPEPADAQGEAAAKQQGGGADKVELSSYIPVVPASQQEKSARVARVAEIKAQVASGTYQVSSKDVAKKMLAKLDPDTTKE